MLLWVLSLNICFRRTTQMELLFAAFNPDSVGVNPRRFFRFGKKRTNYTKKTRCKKETIGAFKTQGRNAWEITGGREQVLSFTCPSTTFILYGSTCDSSQCTVRRILQCMVCPLALLVCVLLVLRIQFNTNKIKLLFLT